VKISKMKNNLTKFTEGFTLIEVSIVLVILTVLVSVIISSFGKVGGSEALDTTTMSVIAVLNEAKSQAVSSKDASDHGVRIFNDKLISFRDSYGTENKEITVSNLVTISTSTGVGSDIVFSNVSGSTNASGTITITVLNDSSKNSVIKIYSTGIIEKN
jgi:prepilin-type N-terminal cleavage/methylation domain-containing protein